MGYFGGVNCALLCTYAAMCYPNAAPAVVLHHCFRIFAEWEYPNPILVKDVEEKPELMQDNNVWNPEKDERHKKDLFPLLTPCYPCQNSCYSVMKSTRDVIVNEFKRGYEITGMILQGGAVGETMEKIMLNRRKETI